MGADGRPGAQDAGPSPAETEALARARIDEASRRRLCAGARALSAFARDPALAPVTPKGDERTNVIDQGERVTYALGPDSLRRLFALLEACRREGSAAHWSERQGTPAAPLFGLMLDYDLRVTARRPAPTMRHYYRIASALAAALQRDIDFAAGAAAPARAASEARLHMFFIVRPETTPLPAEGQAEGAPPLYKYGLHVLLPGVRLSRPYKKYLLRQFAQDPGTGAALADLGAVGAPETFLDQNSASVPVMFFGSCKRGGVPYTLGAALEVTLDLGFAPAGAGAGAGGWAPAPVIRALEAKDLEGYNLVAELSLHAEADYSDGDGRPPLVAKRDYAPRPEAAAAAQDWGERTAGLGAGAPAEELLQAEHDLSTLTLHDAEARHLHALLGLLGGDFLTERNKWRDVVYALANTSEHYRPLALWFSQRCRHRSREAARADDLDALWADAVARRGTPATAGGRPLTLRSVAYWARACDPARYAEAMERSYFTTLTGYVYEFGGRLQHYMVAKVLHAMLGTKFVVDIDAGPRGGAAYCWYEFVLPGQTMRPGEVWKWRKEAEPDDVHIYMSEKLAGVFEQIGEHLEERRAGAADEEQGKYYRGLAKAFAGSRGSLYNDTYKNGVIRQACYLFRRRGFVEQLDRIPFLFGVRNGVLRLGPRVELIDYYHEYPISRFTAVPFRRFDPADPWVALALRVLADIFVEPDARDWILFHSAQGLSGEPKEGLYLLVDGGGANGKTAYLRSVAKALGPYADKFNIQLMCCEREDADRPNSAVMRFKFLNWAYSEETNKTQALNVARMKEIINPGEISGRDLNSRQETFTLRANVVSASQYGFIVNSTDHGTWRRIRSYRAKVKFCRHPDPANTLEKKADQRIVRKYPDDPQWQEAILSILAHYYERLQTEYGGELKNVPSPTIERETEAFRVSQDVLHRWICASVVASPAHPREYSLGVLGGAFIDWYNVNIERKRLVAGEVIKEIESSALAKYIRPSPNRTRVLRGCRVLDAEAPEPLAGEEWLGVAEMRGGRSASEWAEDCAAADSFRAADPTRPWWAARGPAPPPAPDGGEALLFPGDDAALVRAARPRGGPAPGGADFGLDEVLAEVAPGGADAGRPPAFDQEDVYEPGSGASA